MSHLVRNPSSAQQSFTGQARLIAGLVKDRARAFARRPWTLDMVRQGLADASPEAMIVMARQLLDRERRNPSRWFGFGGEIPALNARAVLVLARARRRGERRSPDGLEIRKRSADCSAASGHVRPAPLNEQNKTRR